MRNHLVTADHAAGEIRAHVAELRDRDEIENVKLPSHRAGRRTRHDVNDLGDEIVKPEDVEQPKDRVGHRPQRRVIAKPVEHLAGEHGQEKKKQDRHLEIVGMTGADPGEIIEAPAQHDGAADHRGHFEIRQALVIEHAVEFPERKQAERADQEKERDLVPGKNYPERDRPEDERASKTKKEN